MGLDDIMLEGAMESPWHKRSYVLHTLINQKLFPFRGSKFADQNSSCEKRVHGNVLYLDH